MPLCVFCAGTGLSMGHGTGWVPCPRGCVAVDSRLSVTEAAVRGLGGAAGAAAVAAATGCSPAAAYIALWRLEKAGKLKRLGRHGHYVFSLAKNSP